MSFLPHEKQILEYEKTVRSSRSKIRTTYFGPRKSWENSRQNSRILRKRSILRLLHGRGWPFVAMPIDLMHSIMSRTSVKISSSYSAIGSFATTARSSQALARSEAKNSCSSGKKKAMIPSPVCSAILACRTRKAIAKQCVV